jgi:regulator of sigma E protease
MEILVKVFYFVVTVGLLVTFHEFGHYVAARLMGVRVLRFCVGFGKPLWTYRHGAGTEWVLAAIPLGGYVRMLDGRTDDVAAYERHLAFDQQRLWRRSFIVAAGPAANFLLAILFYWVLFVHGVQGLAPVLAAPPAGTIAAEAGFVAGERVVSIDGAPIVTFSDLRWQLVQSALRGVTVSVTVRDDRQQMFVRKLDLGRVPAGDMESDYGARLGLTPFEPTYPAVLGEVVAGGPASMAGLRPGDRVVAVQGEPVDSWRQMVTRVAANPGVMLRMDIVRDGVHALVLNVTPRADLVGGKTVGRIGVELDRALQRQYSANLYTMVRLSVPSALPEAVAKTWDMAAFSVKMIGKMLVGQVSWKNLSGPVTIADYAGRSAAIGFNAFMEFLALISISLGVINLLPVPVLDGGHLMYHLIEAIKGRPLSDRALEIGQRVGLGVIVFLAFFAIYNDLGRLFAS